MKFLQLIPIFILANLTSVFATQDSRILGCMCNPTLYTVSAIAVLAIVGGVYYYKSRK